MPPRTDGSYNQIAFALEILKLLAEKPRQREELGNIVSDFMGQHGKSSDDILQKVSRMIRKLKDCGFEIKSAPHHPYELVDSSFPVILSTEQRQALAMAAYFLDGMGFSAQASQIIRIGKLTQADLPSDVKVDFSPPVDYCENQLEVVIRQLQERFRQQCRYTIRYQDAQGVERTYDLDRSELRLHDGTLYLFALVPDAPYRHFETRPNPDQNYTFRVDRITRVNPAANIPWGFFHFPTFKIRYRLSGSLANYQPRRDHESIVYRDIHEKFVDIVIEEDCPFWFRQRILRYGASARIIEPEWLARELEDVLKKAHLNYCQNGSQQVASHNP